MLNHAKYKSSLTLILETPISNPSNSYQRPISDCLSEYSCDIYRNDKEMNSNGLSKMSRTLDRSESLNEPLASNETIVPIKYLSQDDDSDSDQEQQDPQGISVDTSPKYCCTLEVKFVWYWRTFKVLLNFKIANLNAITNHRFYFTFLSRYFYI